MDLRLNDIDLNKLDELFNVDECNKTFADFLIDYIDNAKDIAKQYKSNLYDSIVKYFKVSKDFIEYFKDHKLKENIVKLDVNEYTNNPYNKAINLENVTDGLYKFEYQSFKPYEGFLIQDISADENLVEQTKIGYFDTEYKYLTLSYDNNIWMLITPHEINTMKDAINKAYGNVVTFGLGLGYFAYMCSIKENVSSVTIVEKDEKIIELFKKHILPQFESKNKINIVHDDALEYCKHNFAHDYAFVDLWRDTNDGLQLYIKMKQASKIHLTTKFEYWIEEAMIQVVRRAMIAMFYETINNINFEQETTYFDHVVNRLKEIYKNVSITSFDAILNILSREKIKYVIEMV